ncbi:MAG: protein kinase [Myxococcota bacterium]
MFDDLHLHAGSSEIEVDIAAWRYQGSQLLPKFLDALEADRQRFSALVHPQVCRTFDIGRVPSELTCYWVQESPGGVSLLQHLHERSVVVPDLTIHLGLQIAFGLDAIHRAGLLHGDLDPEFIRVIGKDRIKLGWAGLATRVESAGLATGRGTARSLAEMAPETLVDGIVSVASDTYGFAALLYRMLAGTSPFLVRRDAPLTALDTSGALARLPSEVPQVLFSLLATSLELDPRRRPTIEEWVEALRQAERGLMPTSGHWLTGALPRRDTVAQPESEFVEEERAAIVALKDIAEALRSTPGMEIPPVLEEMVENGVVPATYLLPAPKNWKSESRRGLTRVKFEFSGLDLAVDEPRVVASLRAALPSINIAVLTHGSIKGTGYVNNDDTARIEQTKVDWGSGPAPDVLTVNKPKPLYTADDEPFLDGSLYRALTPVSRQHVRLELVLHRNFDGYEVRRASTILIGESPSENLTPRQIAGWVVLACRRRGILKELARWASLARPFTREFLAVEFDSSTFE